MPAPVRSCWWPIPSRPKWGAGWCIFRRLLGEARRDYVEALEARGQRLKDPHAPLYGLPLVARTNVFRAFQRSLANAHQQGFPLPEIVLATAAAGDVVRSYREFSELRERGMVFTLGPGSRLWSAVRGRPVYSFDEAWLRRQLR
jgi:hypothetical protein